MASEYFLLFKTAQAEFRAWDTLRLDAKQHVFPIVELTRGRKIPRSGKGIPEERWREVQGIYDFERTVSKVRDGFKKSDHVIFDLTREEELSSFEIDNLFRSENGYENWVRFIGNEKDNFRDLIPTLLISPSVGESEVEYKANIENQLDAFMREFTGIAYRASVLIDPEFLYDLILLKDKINRYVDDGKKFWIELDHEFIRPGMGILHALTTISIVQKINEIIPKAEIVIVSTSFPRSVDELGDPEHDTFPNEEVYLHEEVAKNAPSNVILHYGDYGSINPLRSDLVFARGGWRPRIDFPTSKRRTYYYREKREKDQHGVLDTYESHYISVAKKVISDSMFEDDPESWGVTQIIAASNGMPPGLNPSFWISVRMEIHMRQQLKRLGLG